MKFRDFFAALFFIVLSAFAANVVAQDTKSENPPTVWKILHVGTVLDIPGTPPKHKQTIFVKDGKIIQVESGYLNDKPLSLEQGDTVETINLKDKFVLPGLLDVHVHLGMKHDHTKGKTKEKGLDTYRLLGAIENANKTLMAGYTTVRNVGSYDWAVFALRDGIRKGVLQGPRIITSGHTIEINTRPEEGSGGCYSVETCRLAVRRQAEMGADLIKVYATCSGSKSCGHKDAPPIFLKDEFKAIVETARSRNMKVAAHAHGTAGINFALRNGANSIEHGSYNDATSHKLFRKTGAFLVPTLSVQDNIIEDFKTAKGDMKNVMEAFLNEHPKRAYAAFKAGVKIAAGSDAGVIAHGDNANELLWYVKIGMSEMQAITAATRNGALLLGMEDQIGSLEVGKFADIIAVDTSPLKDISALKSINFVMKNGVVIKSND